MTVACAPIVRRDDPRLWKTALFAPEPARSGLMVLYAFDIELSRATQASRESLIPRMRLQWWRDVVEDARAGGQPKAHDVAGPLAALLSGPLRHDDGEVLCLIDAHEKTLEIPWTEAEWEAWRDQRYQALLSAANRILTGASRPFPWAGRALADAFVLRHAARMAAEGRPVLLPGLSGADLAALARGTLTDPAGAAARGVAERGLAELDAARRGEMPVERGAVPALLPLLWAERALRMVIRDPAAILGQLDDIDRPFDGFRLAWRVLRRRW